MLPNLDRSVTNFSVGNYTQTHSAPGVKRLAIRTEDHELSYMDFQGIIAEGEDGAGTVETWDKGTYVLEEISPKQIRFTLKGQR